MVKLYQVYSNQWEKTLFVSGAQEYNEICILDN